LKAGVENLNVSIAKLRKDMVEARSDREQIKADMDSMYNRHDADIQRLESMINALSLQMTQAAHIEKVRPLAQASLNSTTFVLEVTHTNPGEYGKIGSTPNYPGLEL
jgi:hypothetical protein